MDINPDDAQQYLQGVEYPASKEDVVSAAENNGAPEDLMRMITGLSRPDYSEEEQVLEDLRSIPKSNWGRSRRTGSLPEPRLDARDRGTGIVRDVRWNDGPWLLSRAVLCGHHIRLLEHAEQVVVAPVLDDLTLLNPAYGNSRYLHASAAVARGCPRVPRPRACRAASTEPPIRLHRPASPRW